MEINLTGNPFVDTGIFTIKAHLARELGSEPKEVLQVEDVKKAFESKDGFAKWLARANRQLKSFFMVVGTNSALVNPSNNKAMNKSKNYGLLDEIDSGWQNYVAKLQELSSELIKNEESELSGNEILCESCGERKATQNLDSIGRDYFPLAGSIGNDAQALPAASRAPKICPLCLLAVHWLPLGTGVFNRGLACFQFTEPILTQDLTQSIYERNRSQLDTTPVNEKLSISFSSDEAKSGKSKKSLGQLLFETINQFNYQRKRNNLPETVTLNIWTFSNAGQSADSDFFEIPNPSLQFFWDGLKHKTELEKILQREDPKKPATHLLSAIEQQREYLGFYPQKAKKGEAKSQIATVGLFDLYQTKVLKRTQFTLDSAKLFAKLAHEKLQSEAENDKNRKKFYEQILKENPRLVKDPKIRVGLRKMLIEFAEEGKIKLDNYVALFPVANLQSIENLTIERALEIWKPYEPNETPKGEAIRRTNKGWDLFWFYFHHAENGTLNFDEEKILESNLSGEEIVMFTNPKVKEFAKDVFEWKFAEHSKVDKQKGLEWIKKVIINGFSRGKMTVADLRKWFGGLSEFKEGYSNEDWDTFCRDEWGNLAVGELLFQFRLELGNLYREKSNELS
ncbi:MAG: type I-B CRISPR-associated protein Cas8b1/Cst1 [Pyrinomonadaceae bacterium]|nr:type I-B CRISPR-associated protein Cas8b1/Cst1 [Pyrinomonadaceae bacterium]